MTAVVVAMLGIVIVATLVLAAVGGYHHLAHSPRTRRRVRRWLYVLRSRWYDLAGGGMRSLAAARRLGANAVRVASRTPRELTAVARRVVPR